MNVATRCGLVAALALLGSGCVSSARYAEAVAQRDGERALAVEAAARCRAQEAKARAEQAGFAEIAERDAATIQDLWGRLEQSGLTKEQLIAERSALALKLGATRVRLAALRQAQRAAESRAAVYREVATKLKAMVDSGEIQVLLRDGRMVIVLPSDVLFDSGSTEVKPGAREGLHRVAAVLRSLKGRHFQVAGHTDTVPIATARFPSNWELSAGRALVVTGLLVDDGVLPEVVSAAAYGQFDPAYDNATPEGRMRNRRIEITLMPELAEQVVLPD